MSVSPSKRIYLTQRAKERLKQVESIRKFNSLQENIVQFDEELSETFQKLIWSDNEKMKQVKLRLEEEDERNRMKQLKYSKEIDELNKKIHDTLDRVNKSKEINAQEVGSLRTETTSFCRDIMKKNLEKERFAFMWED